MDLGHPWTICQVRRNGISMAEYDHVCAFLATFPSLVYSSRIGQLLRKWGDSWHIEHLFPTAPD